MTVALRSRSSDSSPTVETASGGHDDDSNDHPNDHSSGEEET